MSSRTSASARGSKPVGARRAPSFQCHVTAGSQFTELVRQKASGGWAESGEVFGLEIDRRALVQRVSMVLRWMCEFEREVAIHFGDAQESSRLNSSYRGRFAPTDVLSFPAAEENLRLHRAGVPATETRRLGDILLCVPVCAVQAREHRVSLSAELERMLVHGMCHLRGFDHERSAPAHGIMDGLESCIRRMLVKECGKADWARRSEYNG